MSKRLSKRELIEETIQQVFKNSGWEDSQKKRKLILAYIEKNELEEDLKTKSDAKSTALSFIQYRMGDRRQAEDRNEDAQKEITLDRGFLQNLITFAGLQPKLLEFRKEVLGTTKPLNWLETVRWLERESKAPGEPEYFIQPVSFEFILPQSFLSHDSKAPFGSEKYWREHISLCIANHLEIAPFYNGNRGTLIPTYVYFDGQRNRLIRMRSGKALLLFIRAEELHRLCPSIDRGLFIDLILHGNMYSLRPNIDFKSNTFDSENLEKLKRDEPDASNIPTLNYWGIMHRNNLPVMNYHIPYLEMHPDEVAALHAEVRDHYNVSEPRGRPMTKESEVLGLAAIQLVWLEEVTWRSSLKWEKTSKGYGLGKEGVAGFGSKDLERIREQYRKIAPFYGLNPDHFHVRIDAKGKKKRIPIDTIRKALERLNERYYKFMQQMDSRQLSDVEKFANRPQNQISLFTQI